MLTFIQLLSCPNLLSLFKINSLTIKSDKTNNKIRTVSSQYAKLIHTNQTHLKWTHTDWMQMHTRKLSTRDLCANFRMVISELHCILIVLFAMRILEKLRHKLHCMLCCKIIERDHQTYTVVERTVFCLLRLHSQ